MATGPGDELAAGAAPGGNLRASHADREQVVDALKATFTRGLLAKDEFDLRLGQALTSRTYAELAAVTAGLPAEPPESAADRPPGPADTLGEILQRPGRLLAAATAIGATVWGFVFLPPWPRSTGVEADPPHAVIYLFFLGNLACLLTLLFSLIAAVNVATMRHQERSARRS